MYHVCAGPRGDPVFPLSAGQLLCVMFHFMLEVGGARKNFAADYAFTFFFLWAADRERER